MYKLRFLRYGTPVNRTYHTFKEAARFAVSVIEENSAVPTEIRKGDSVVWRYKDGSDILYRTAQS